MSGDDMHIAKPLVSIVMNCYNSEKYLREAIDSIFAQTYQHWEIIFWDNASVDASAEIAKSYDDRLHYYRGTETVPLYAARNKALEKCNGEFIAFLDCDDLWLPRKLEKQIPLFSDQLVALVYSDSLFMAENGLRKKNFSTRKPVKGYALHSLLNHYCLDIESVVLRRSVLTKYDLKFDDSLNLIGDFELFMQVAYYGKLDFVNEVLVKSRFHLHSLTNNQRQRSIAEFEYVYDKMIQNFPDEFNSRSLRKLLGKIQFYKAKENWSIGKQNYARKNLLSVLFLDPRYIIFFILTFIPYRIISKVLARLHPVF